MRRSGEKVLEKTNGPVDAIDYLCVELLMLLKEKSRAEGKLLYQFGVMRIALGVMIEKRLAPYAPMLGAPHMYEVKMKLKIRVVER